jgi:uncharacterized membrane protein
MELPLHPAIVHLPLGLAVVLPIAALGVAVALWRGWLPARAWVGVVALQALLVGGGLLALSTGEADEERVESAVGEAAIESHEHAAKRFVIAGGLTLAVAATALAFASRPKWQRSAQLATVAMSAGVLLLALNVGHQGGQLVYGRGGAAAWTSASAGDGESAPAQREGKKGDRDGDDD